MVTLNGTSYYTLREVAQAADKAPNTVKRWFETGKIPKPMRAQSSGYWVFTEEQKDQVLSFANKVVAA